MTRISRARTQNFYRSDTRLVMTTESSNSVRSEKGMALITVLLLLAVVSALTTALAMSGQTEVAMASNEVYYAGARAAAEAGLNRAAEHLNDVATLNLLAGADGNPNATADNGVVPTIGNGPFTLTNQYTYTLQIVDDDNPVLYVNTLSAAQLGQMNEQSPANPNVSQNNMLILRATGLGPRNTRVIVQRVINVTTIPQITNTPVQTQSNPAILVNGDLSISGSMVVGGTQGNVHANGNVDGSGSSYDVRGNLTATGSFSGNVHADGIAAPNMPAVAVPEIKAADYMNLADFILTDSGTIIDRAGTLGPVACGTAILTTRPCPTGWSFSSGTWSASGKIPSSATYYVQGNATVHGTGNSAMTSLSIIAEGNLTLTGNAKFRPENTSGIQFVTNGDFQLGGTTDADEDTIDMDGQILVREQMDIYGNSEFQGRVIVEDRDGASNAYNAATNPHGRRGADAITSNQLRGNMTVTYNGGLGNITTTNIIPVAGAPTYTNNVSGWIES
jgi:Tfp pilus assembly protein PilX